MTILIWMLVAALLVYNAYMLGTIAGHVLYINNTRKDLRK